jgi:hypothetical protein
MATAKLFLTNWEIDPFSETLSCEAWFHDGVNRSEMNAVEVASVRIGDHGLVVKYAEPGFGEMMNHLPISNGLDFSAKILGALDRHFDADCEVYADCFRDGDITVLELETAE